MALKRIYPIVLLTLLALATVINCIISINYTTDDPFITYRYSVNLVNGHGLVYNIGEYVEGYSNPTWVFIMAGFYLLLSGCHPLAMLWAAKIFGIALLLFSLIIIYKAERIVDADGFPFATLFIAINPAVMLWAAGGLETALCVFLVSVILYDEVKNNGGIIGSLAVGILAVSRPEMPLILIFYSAWTWFRKRRGWQNAALRILISCIPIIIWLIFRLAYYNDIFPNTYYAKAQSLDVSEGALYLAQALVLFNYFYFLIPLAIAGLLRSEIKGWLLAIVLSGGYFGFIVLSGGDWMPGGRFLIHVSPLLSWIVGAGFKRVYSKFNLTGQRIFIIVIIISMAMGTVLAHRFIHEKFTICPWPWEKLSMDSPVYPHYLEMGVWMAENTDPDASVALGEAGLIPYLSHNVVIDCFGLMDTHIARLPGELHRKFDAEYVMGREPEYILLLGSFDGDSLSSRFLYCRELYTHPDFRNYTLDHNVRDLYLFKRVKVPTGLN